MNYVFRVFMQKTPFSASHGKTEVLEAGAMLTIGKRTVIAALRVKGLA